MDPFGIKVIFITILVFIPLERLFAMHPQKIFRRNWGNDLIFLLLNGILIKLGLLAVIVAVILVTAWIVPASFQAMVGGLPYWIQIPAVISLIPVFVLGFSDWVIGVYALLYQWQ